MKKFLLIFIILSASIILYSQTTINAPFVSKISIEASNGRVLLKWQNPSTFNDYITIYRSSGIIDSKEKIISSTKIVILKNKEEKYIDSPGEPGNYFYAVIITKKSTNQDEAIFVSYRNFTSTPTVVLKTDFFKITKLNVSSFTTYNKIEWEFESQSNAPIKLMVYRNTKIINSTDELNSSIKIATLDLNTKLYIDVPIANIPYYYAIFLEGEINKIFIPEVNITSNSFVINSKKEIFNNFSIDNFIPLPLLVLKSDPESGKFFLDKQILTNPKIVNYSDNIKKIITDDKILYKKIYSNFLNDIQKDLQLLGFHLLDNEEIFEPKEYQMEYKSAIKFISNKDFISSLNIFEEMIKNILPEEMLDRVAFYIGILYYLKGDFYNSYMYLVYSNDKYKKEVQPYLKSIELNIFSKLER